jgi:hypothetical protein
MWWQVLQVAVGGALMLSEGALPWSTGPLVAPFCATGAAWLVTAAVSAVLDLTIGRPDSGVERRRCRNAAQKAR